MDKKTSYTGIDCFRMAAALLVVAIHTDPLDSYNETANFILCRVIARIAVPFFFVCSGYFFTLKMTDDSRRNRKALRKFITQTGALYLLAVLVYLPFNWYNGYFFGDFSFSAFVKDLLINGTFYHLWYLPALITGMIIVYLLVKKLPLSAVAGITGVLYMVGLLGDSYFGFVKNLPWLDALYGQLFSWFDYTRNGFLFAPLFITLGVLFARREKAKMFTNANIALLFLCSILFCIEALLLKKYHIPRHDSMTLFVVPVVYLLFSLLLKEKGKEIPYLRSVSLWIYIFHPLMIIVVRGFGKFLGLTAIVVGNSLVHYILVTVFSICFSLLISIAIKAYKNGNPMNADGLRAYAEINLSNLRHNLEEIKKIVPPGCTIMAVVKADAYGHGSVMVAKCLQKAGVRSFAVAELEEAITLRKSGIKGEILILGYTPVSQKYKLIWYGLTQSIISEKYAKALCETVGTVKAHVKLDTGMNRLGEKAEDIRKIFSIYKEKRLKITGTYSHLAEADSLSKEDIAFTTRQISSFYEAISTLKNQGVLVGRVHLQSSYGILNYPGLHCDLVRPGIALYGVLSKENDTTIENLALRPVLSLKAKVMIVKEIKAGESVGYGNYFIAEQDCKIAVISIGYADGYPRSVSGIGCKVLVRGRQARIVGNICMDQMMIDITEIAGVEEGDIVTLIGRDGEEALSVNQLSRLGDTINNEILSRIGARVRKVYYS